MRLLTLRNKFSQILCSSIKVSHHQAAAAMSSIPTLKLNSGYDIPVLGLGTWKSQPGEVRKAVEHALDAGYRHLDCAMIYENEKEVGEAIAAKIKEGILTRDQLFVTSKLWNTYHEPDMVEAGCKKTLQDLGLDYLDLYLMHFPIGFKQKSGITSERDADNKIVLTDRDYVDTWIAMEELTKKKLVRSIGVSNFSASMLQRVLDKASIPPATNQVECHPYLNQKVLSKACNDKGVLITAYSPFASPDRPWAKPDDPKLLEEPKILAIAKKYNKSAAQILLRYQIELGHVTIPKSVSPTRLLENTKIFDFKLSPEDMTAIESLECQGRVVKMDFCAGHQFYPF